MPLTLVLGPANSAKAGEVLGAYALAAHRDALLVVPTATDVAHYERELAAPGVTLGRTLTFPRLIEEIAVRARHRRTRLTPLQCERVMRRTVASLRLGPLAASAAGAGFARAAGRLIAELEQERVTPARFGSALRQWAGGAAERDAYGRELAAIYMHYQEELAGLDRDDAESFAWGALDALRERPDRWGATPVFFYGFDDLTAVELDTIETLSRQADAAVTVSLTYEPDRPALAARATVVEELRRSAQSVSQLPALEEYYAPAARAALHHLERHLFEADPPVIDPGDAVVLMEAGGELAEAELVAAGVLAALADGVPAEEIVVVCRSLNRSGELFERELARHGVAVTSARRLPLEHTALGGALLALTRSALLPASQRTVADLISYLRHPGLVEPADAVDRLEAELRRSGMRRLSAARTREPALRPALDTLEQLRRARDPAGALPDHVRRLLAAPYRGSARLLSAAEQLDARAATAVLSALAELEQLGEARALPAAELIELLEGLLVPAHGPVPAGAVLIAEPLSIRARRFRQVFVTGLCEGEFPAAQSVSRDPFLGEERRRELALASGLALPPAGDPLDRERYLLYACISRATERVSFSYRSSDEDGNVVIVSPFLEDITELFGAGWHERRRRRLLADVVWSVEEAPSEWERVVASAFARSRASARSGVAEEPPATLTLSEQALAHARHRQIVSAGALETFASCPVRWLVERQLNVKDLEPEAEPLVRGSFIHSVLERVFARLDGALTPQTLPEAEALLREEIHGNAAEASGLAVGQPPEVRAAVVRGIEAALRRYLRHEAADGCDWVPLGTELRFGLDGDAEAATPEGAMPPVALDDGHNRVLLSGIVDRVDADPRDSGRVIVRDYKSGARRDSWPVARWLSDRQIQVALYMIAVQRLLEVRVVAGFYQPLAGEDLRGRGVYESGAGVGTHALSRDELSEDKLEELLDAVEKDAVGLAAILQRGQLTPCPETCSADGSCRHPGICWAER